MHVARTHCGPGRLALSAALGLVAAGCDFTPSLDISTPAHSPSAVLRTVLPAGAEALVHLSVSRDPYGVQQLDRPPSPTPVDARVTLQRDGQPAEVLVIRPQTCYLRRESVCNAATGLTEVSEQGPFECGAFASAAPVEPGATYTVRAEVPGLSPAQASVTVPPRAEIAAWEEPSGDPGTRRLQMRVHDVAGSGSRYALSILREFDRYVTTVCAVGGPRDTTVTLASPARYQTRFATSDPVLLASAREPSDALEFVTFTDETFEGGPFEFTVDVPTIDDSSTATPTGRLVVQLAVLSEVLYEAFQITYFSLGDYNPFAEPINLPSNVEGGLGRVGAVAVTEIYLASPFLELTPR